MSDDAMRSVSRVMGRPLRGLSELGAAGAFFGRAILWVPKAVARHQREQVRLLAEVGLGSGALAALGGSIAITGMLCLFAGSTAGVQAFQFLADLDLQALNGFGSAYIGTRMVAPLIAGAGLAATVGTGMTAQIGAMRINEEIDALEVMGVRSLPYLVSTRLVAGFIVIIPLYVVALILSWFGYRVVAVTFYGQSGGTFDHYFFTFLQPIDIVYAFLQAMAMAVVVMLVHTYYGYTASGGPAGVGVAVGKAVRTSLIGVTTVNLLVAVAVYGASNTVRISG